MRLGSVLTVVGALLLRVGTSAACSAPGLALGPVAPADQASGVALNAPILVDFQAVPPTDETYAFSDIASASLSLVEVETETVLQTTARQVAANRHVSVYVPNAKLEPNTRYRAESSLGARWDFTTGDEQRAALRLEGAIAVSFEAGSEARIVCDDIPGSCGGPCTEVGSDDVTKARLTLPAVLDGFSAERLWAYVSISDETAAPNDTPIDIYTQVVPGKAGEALVTMPVRADRKPYHACFTFTATDARGDSVKTAQVCSSDEVPVPPEAEPEPKPQQPEPDPKPQQPEPQPQPPARDIPTEPLPTGTPEDDAAHESAKANVSSGCHVGGPRHGSAGSVALAFALTLASWVRRRRGTLQ